jgi:hypothetical protein
VRGDVTNPQSLNLYAYVTDNPTTLNDPSGMCGCGGGGFGFGEGGGGWGGFGGRRGGGPPPPPPIIPIPGPVTTSIAGGGLFSDPFSFIEQSPPWLPPDLPLPPWPTPSSRGTRTCSEKKKSEPQLFNICLDYPCGKGKQKFIESWSCTGDWACCLPLKDKFVDSCYDRGKGYVAHEYWYNKSAPEVDCCYCAE